MSAAGLAARRGRMGRVMFSYYGSKSKVIDLYPAPRYGKIIEPFAGSARYALKYWDRDVLIVDAYEVVIKIWRYLQQASVKDIMSLPSLTYGQTTDDCSLSEGERLLLGFLVARGVASPQKIVQKFSDIESAKVQISKELFKIRNWKIEQGNYRSIENQQATWFIDPPYQVGGQHYHESEIDFISLGAWAKSRDGQVIVCENTKADWLPFTPIGNMGGAYSKTTEAIWSNDFQQAAMKL